MKSIFIICLLVNLPYQSVYSETLHHIPIVTSIKETKSNGKSIYIYNTHQSEKYKTKSVKDGSKYLKQLLENKGYEVDYESEDFELYKLKNNINYSYSYTVSKKYLNKALQQHGNYDLVIDFHRDSIPKDLSTLTLDNKSYAKLLFVVGQGSKNYEDVYSSCEKISDLLNEKIPGISKGIMKKQSDYNQGVTSNMMLIEVGAHENTYEEVKNTLNILSVVIDEYLNSEKTDS